MGSSCFLQTPFLQSLPITSPSSQSFLLCSHTQNAKHNKKHRAIFMASHRNETDLNKRRAILVLGISALPFLQLKAGAVESLVKEERDTRTLEENQSAEQLHQGEAPSIPFLSLLNVVGIIGSGVLGALYTLAQKEKTATNTTIESLKNRLVEKDIAMVSMEKNFEKRLLNEHEERGRQKHKAKEEQRSISNQLTTADSTIAGLRKELQNEKRLVEELTTQMDKLQNGLIKAGEDNKVLEEKLKEKLDLIEVLQDKVNLLTLEIKDEEYKIKNLNSSLSEKVLECENLTFINKRAKEDLAEANSEMKSLKEELLKNREDLDSKNSVVDVLNGRIVSLATERDEINEKLKTLQKDYNDLNSSSEKKAASDAELLGKREHEVHQLEEKLRLALNEVSSNQNSIVSLTQERDGLRTLVDVEVNNVENLRHDVLTTQEILQTSRKEVADLSEQLRKARMTCEELASETVRVQTEFDKARESSVNSLEEARSNSKVLSGELASVKKDLEKTKEEFQVVSDELARATETQESLKKELLDVYKKAERVSHELKTERTVVATLQKQLEASEKQILKDKEARKSLETDLEDATKSLDEVNKNVLMLSRELDIANSRVENIEVEKDMLHNTLMEQKNLSKEARENIEDAHDIIMKLGKERESLDKRGRKLEEELASAKGEILRLRSQKNSSKSPVNDVQKKNSTEAEKDNVVSVKKVGRRKKSGVPSSEAPK